MKQIPSIKKLRNICKKKSGATGYVVPATDYLAVYPAKLFLYLPFTPNQITIIWIILKIIGALLLINGNYLIMILGLLIFQFSSILDAVDGIVARYRKRYSLNGIYVDLLGHYITNSLLLLTLAIAVYKQTDSLIYFIPAGIGIVVQLLSKALTINLAWYTNPEQRKKVDQIIYTNNLTIRDQKSKLMLVVFDFMRIEDPLNLMFWGVVLGFPGVVLWIYAVFITLEMLRKVLLQYLRIARVEKKEKDEKKEINEPKGSIKKLD